MKFLLNYIGEVKSEVSRVVWPTTKETATSVALVMGMVVIASIVFLAIDTMLYSAISFILG